MKMFKTLFIQQPASFNAIMAGLGATAAIYALALLGNSLQFTLLMAPFGASCVLIFLLPKSPLSQARNVIGGHLLSSSIGLLAYSLFQYLGNAEANGYLPLFMAAAVGSSITAMAFLKVVHPPAGADPLVVFMTHAPLEFLIFPVLIGSVLLVLAGLLQQRMIKLLTPAGESHD